MLSVKFIFNFVVVSLSLFWQMNFTQNQELEGGMKVQKAWKKITNNEFFHFFSELQPALR